MTKLGCSCHPLLVSALLPPSLFKTMFIFFLRIVARKMLLGYSVTQVLFSSNFELKILVPTRSLSVPQHSSLIKKQTCADKRGRPAHGSQGQGGISRTKAEQQLLVPAKSNVYRTGPFLGCNQNNVDFSLKLWKFYLHSLSRCLKTWIQVAFSFLS